MGDTAIEWTDKTWNPTTGCDKISAGCDNCYALTLAKRLKGMGQAKYQNDGDPRTSGPGFGLTLHPDSIDTPRSWRKPAMVFVNSMSDLFHAKVPLYFIQEVFAVIRDTPHLTYQVLTKRARRARLLSDRLDWPPNLWMGTSVEDATELHRVDELRRIPAAVRFLSCEPLLGPLDGLDVAGIHWCIVGGESGGGARAMALAWAQDIVDRCRERSVPVHVKQLGSVWARSLSVDGQRWANVDPKGGKQDHWPASLRVREFPEVSP